MAHDRASFEVTVNGEPVSSEFVALVLSITINQTGQGKTADTASVELDDDGGQILLPSDGDPISIALGWDDDAPTVQFDGTIDKVSSKGGRGSGRTVSISAKSADIVKGKAKQKRHKHKDSSSFKDVATAWGQDAGLTVTVHPDLASIQRDYWGMHGESFLHWGSRIASDLAATFKVEGTQGVFAPRSGGTSVGGEALGTVTAIAGDGGNLISWDIEPIVGRPSHAKYRTKTYDPKAAEWDTGDEDPETETDAEAEHTSRFPHPTKAHAQSKSKSNSKEADRDRGTGTVVIDGEPSAQCEAPCQVTGARAGVDGTYKISTVEHSYTRGGGYTTSLGLVQPTGGAGADTREATAGASSTPSTSTPAPSTSTPVGQGGIGHA